MVKMLIEASEGYCPVCGELMGAVMLHEYPRREEQTVTAWVCEACSGLHVGGGDCIEMIGGK